MKNNEEVKETSAELSIQMTCPSKRKKEDSLRVHGRLVPPGEETITRRLEMLVDTGAECLFMSWRVYQEWMAKKCF